MGRPNRWGIVPAILKTHVYEVCEEYPRMLTLRGLFYRLGAMGYPNELGFFKYLSRWCVRWRIADPDLNRKFIDLGRLPIIPKPPSVQKIEAWMEKQSTYVVLRDILEKYRLPVQVQRGYGSLSMFSRAIRRAHKRGVELIAYFGDTDPSGLDIQRIARKKMFPVKLKKISITWGQIGRYKLPPRPTKPKDRRTPKYVEKYGNQAYEIEALDPRVLRRITEQKLRKLIPPEELRELELSERAAKVTLELLKPARERIEKMVRGLLERGLSQEEIRRRLGGRIKF
jgi:hypothetical protein